MALLFSSGTLSATDTSSDITFSGAGILPVNAKHGDEIRFDGYAGFIDTIDYELQTATIDPPFSGTTGSGKSFSIRRATPISVSASETLESTYRVLNEISAIDAKGPALFLKHAAGAASDENPGVGIVAMNSTVPAEVTELYISKVDIRGRSTVGFVGTWTGKWTLVERTIDTGEFLSFITTAVPTEHADYFTVPVTHLDNDGTITTTQLVVIGFVPGVDYDALNTATSAAEAAQSAAEAARDASVAAKDDSQAAQAASESARDASVAAQTASETAQGLSEDARDAAQGYRDETADYVADLVALTGTTFAGAVHAAASQSTIADADEFGFYKAADGSWIKITWGDIRGLLIDPDGTAAADTDLKAASQKAMRTYIASYIAAQDAEVVKGGIDCSTNPNYPAADAGNIYRVTVAGKIGGASGVAVEVNDRLECFVDGSASGDQATVGANWIISQGNIDGAVTGPASAVDENLPLFDGASGKIIKDSGVALADLAAATDLVFKKVESIRTVSSSIVAADAGKTIVINSATDTIQTLDAAATLGAGWTVIVENIGAGKTTLQISGGADFDNGLASIDLTTEQSLVLQSNGTVIRLLLRGGGGASTGGSFVVEEQHTGDGTNTALLTNLPISADTCWLQIGGVPQPSTAFSLAGRTITFSEVIPTGVPWSIKVLTGTITPGVDPLYQKYTGAGLTYTMPGTPTSDKVLMVIVGGVIQPKDGSAYTWSGTTLTLSEDPGTDLVEVWIIQPLGIGVPADDTIDETKLKVAAIPAIRGALGVDLLGGFRNKIINGDFTIWQRGISQTTSGYASDDRWANEFVGGSQNAGRSNFITGTPEAPGVPVYFASTFFTHAVGAGNYHRKSQKIEGVSTLAGSKATVTLYARADAERSIALELQQGFGSGGTPSSTVNTFVGKPNLTTVFQKFQYVVDVPSITGKTLGTGGNDYLQLGIWLEAGSNFDTRTGALGQQSGRVDIAHVSVVPGDASSESDPFSPRHIQQELALCQRYYTIVPAYALGGTVFAASAILVTAPLPVPMRNGAATISLLATAAAIFHNGYSSLTGTLLLSEARSDGQSVYAQLNGVTGSPATGSSVVGFSATGVLSVDNEL